MKLVYPARIERFGDNNNSWRIWLYDLKHPHFEKSGGVVNTALLNEGNRNWIIQSGHGMAEFYWQCGRPSTPLEFMQKYGHLFNDEDEMVLLEIHVKGDFFDDAAVSGNDPEVQ